MVMRLIPLLCLGLVMSARAEPAIPAGEYPTLPQRGSLQAFVPAGWVLEFEKRGDLNGDGIDDRVMVVRMHNPANILDGEDLGMSLFDANPRMLLVAFAEPDGEFRLVVQDHELIPSPDLPPVQDFLAHPDDGDGGIAIGKGTFSVSLMLWSPGAWITETRTFTFRYQQDCFRLIGFDNDILLRKIGDTMGSSFDFLTHRVKRVRGSIDIDTSVEHWESIPRQPLRCLQEIGNGFEFQPSPDVSDLD